MSTEPMLNRRLFLRRAIAGLGAAAAAPHVVAASALGKEGGPPPSEQIVVGAIGHGGRGSYDLRFFLLEPDVRVVAVCDVRAERREAGKKMVDAKYGNQDCATYRDLRELLARPDVDAVLVATQINWHGLASILAAKGGKDVYCEKPCTKSIAESLALAETFRRTGRLFQAGTQRRSVPHFMFAVELARTGKLGNVRSLHGQIEWHGTSIAGPRTMEPDLPEPPREEFDWDLFLGPTAWQPYKRTYRQEGGVGNSIVGHGILNMGTHWVDLCQWANDTELTTPVEYEPPADSQAVARYANGVKLVLSDRGWPRGAGVRFEGDAGWVETGDSGKLAASPPALLAGGNVARFAGGYPVNFHIRDFLDCVKSRSQPRANADVACHGHIACHAVNIATFLNRKLRYDPQKHEFINDAQANRLRSEALREPWRL